MSSDLDLTPSSSCQVPLVLGLSELREVPSTVGGDLSPSGSKVHVAPTYTRGAEARRDQTWYLAAPITPGSVALLGQTLRSKWPLEKGGTNPDDSFRQASS